MGRRPLQGSATDPAQLARSERVMRRAIERQRAMYEAVMTTPAGRFVMWDLIRRCGVFEPIWTANAEIHAKAARHDFGLDLIQQLQVVSPALYQLMEREWWATEKREDLETEAAHTPASTTAEGEHDDR